MFKQTPPYEDQAEPAEVIVTTGPDSHLAVYDEPLDSPETEIPALPMPSAYLPILSILGAGLMLMGWFGMTTGSQHADCRQFQSGARSRQRIGSRSERVVNCGRL